MLILPNNKKNKDMEDYAIKRSFILRFEYFNIFLGNKNEKAFLIKFDEW